MIADAGKDICSHSLSTCVVFLCMIVPPFLFIRNIKLTPISLCSYPFQVCVPTLSTPSSDPFTSCDNLPPEYAKRYSNTAVISSTCVNNIMLNGFKYEPGVILHCKFYVRSRGHFCDKWVPVTMAWRILRLQMQERPPDMEGGCKYIE